MLKQVFLTLLLLAGVRIYSQDNLELSVIDTKLLNTYWHHADHSADGTVIFQRSDEGKGYTVHFDREEAFGIPFVLDLDDEKIRDYSIERKLQKGTWKIGEKGHILLAFDVLKIEYKVLFLSEKYLVLKKSTH